MRATLLRAGIVLALATGMTPVAWATIITVNATDDSLATDGNCSLREAIIAANTDSVVDACPAGNGADVVVVPAGTYTLTLVGAEEDAAAAGDLDVTGDLELSGAGASMTVIDGNATDRVLDVDPAAAGLTVQVSGVTLQNGGGVTAGGAVRNAGSLTVSDSIVQDSTVSDTNEPRGGGIASSGPLRVERSIVRDNAANGFGAPVASVFGGGIYGAGPIDVVASTITHNIALIDGSQGLAQGGGISTTGTLTLVDSTVSDNGATRGFFQGPKAGVGGGVALAAGEIRNSTVSGNGALFAGGVVIGGGGSVTFSNATVTANSPDGIEAVVGPVTVVLRNSIVAGNPGDDCAASFDGTLTTVGNAYNLDSDGTCMLSGTDQSGVDAMLAPLADNGGPTFTHALLVGSPAVDAGSPDTPGSGGTACEATDQRAVARPVGTRCDVGAFEGAVTSTTTSTTSTTSTTLCPSTPQGGCQPAASRKATLSLKSIFDHAKDRLSFSWTGSSAVPLADFENPVAGPNDYTICLYDQTGRRLEATAPAGVCPGVRPCWKASSTSFKYKDSNFHLRDGITSVLLKASTEPGKARIKVKGKGASLGITALPLATPARLQVLRRFTPTCWEATFGTASRNDAEQFKARSDP